MRSVRCLKLLIGLLASFATFAFSPAPAAAIEIWSGLTYSFVSTAEVPAQDIITPNVTLAHGTTFGLYNAAQEMSHETGVSPKRTLWATKFNNPEGSLIAASNWADLNYTDWRTAYGGPGLLAENIDAANAVLYLIDDDVYLDIQFTQWGQGFGNGGAFAYLRAVPIPEPATVTLAAMCLLFLGCRRRSRKNP